MTRSVDCAECGTTFEAKNARAKYCSDRCRKKVSRRPAKKGKAADETAPAALPQVPTIVGNLILELNQLGALNTSDGAIAVALGYRIESAMESGSAAASCAKELAAVVARIKAAHAPKDRDGIDQLKERRDAKRAS